MQQNIHEQHIFAFYYPTVTHMGCTHGTQYCINDHILCHRIMHVVRLHHGDPFILFDQHMHIGCVLGDIHKKSIQFTVTSHQCNTVHVPHITVLLPLLKKDAFEETLYAATELGANVIQLIMTKKGQRLFGGTKEFERIYRILQAAAEQSKNFSYPKVLDPVPFEQAIMGFQGAIKIFFDPDGCQLYDVIRSIQSNIVGHIVILAGPEGDLTTEEKCLVRKNDFIFCRLTPTILRAQQAFVVSMATLRSLLSNSQ
jgi:RsmE family RNA methyltransferase